MRPCSKPWGVNKGARAGGLSKTQGVPRGAKGSRGTGVTQQGKVVAKTGAMPKQARITRPQTGRDSLTDPPPPRSSSSVPAATLPASPQLAAQQNLSHGLLPPKLDQLPSELPLKQSLQLLRVDPLQPYNCREPPQRFSSLAQALQLITKRSVNPVIVHAAAALHARGTEVLHRRKWESVDAAVFWVVLKECLAKPTNKQYADALSKATRNKVSAPTISSGAKMLSDDSAFVSALKSELSRLTQSKSTARDISSSPAMDSASSPMPSSNRTKRSREDPADLSLESAHMGPHVTSSGQEATNLSSAADVESVRPEKKKMCFGVGQPSSGAVSQVGDSSNCAGDFTTVCGDMANDAAATAGVPFNPTLGNLPSTMPSQTQEEDQIMMDAGVALGPSDFGNNESDFDLRQPGTATHASGLLGTALVSSGLPGTAPASSGRPGTAPGHPDWKVKGQR
ncbi:hypothetical protein WJX82_010884 [Trebouxia sp. C0006]